MLNILTNT